MLCFGFQGFVRFDFCGGNGFCVLSWLYSNYLVADKFNTLGFVEFCNKVTQESIFVVTILISWSATSKIFYKQIYIYTCKSWNDAQSRHEWKSRLTDDFKMIVIVCDYIRALLNPPTLEVTYLTTTHFMQYRVSK